MTLVSSLQSTHLCRKMEEAMPRAHSALSSSSGLYFSLRDIDEELDEIEESKVYVAVGKEVQEWMENLKWLLKSTDKNLTIVFLHVHQPAKKIATPSKIVRIHFFFFFTFHKSSTFPPQKNILDRQKHAYMWSLLPS